jgi:hypothetical protein
LQLCARLCIKSFEDLFDRRFVSMLAADAKEVVLFGIL